MSIAVIAVREQLYIYTVKCWQAARSRGNCDAGGPSWLSVRAPQNKWCCSALYMSPAQRSAVN